MEKATGMFIKSYGRFYVFQVTKKFIIKDYEFLNHFTTTLLWIVRILITSTSTLLIFNINVSINPYILK